MSQLEIEFQDGSSQSFTLFSASIVEEWKTQSRANVEIDRQQWQGVVDKVDKINDEFYVSVDGSREFGGRLVDYSNNADRVVLSIGSFEEDALTAKPTDPTETFSGVSDQTIVNDALSRVPNLTGGSIETIADPIGFTFSNTSPARMIRDVQSASAGFVTYNADKTVDYEELPTGSTPIGTVGPDVSNVQDEFTVIENEREEFTNIRVLGAGEGNGRIQVEGSVGGVSGRNKWGTFSDTSINSKSTANRVLNNLIQEYSNTPVRRKVETTVFGLDLELGTKVTVQSSTDGIDEDMFVTKLEKVLQGDQFINSVTLSNRLMSNEDTGRQQRQAIENFNSGYQGQIVTINSGGHRAPVDVGTPYRFNVRYPDDVVTELSAEVEVEGLYYRSYGSFNGHSHGVNVNASSTAEANSDYESVVQQGSAIDSAFVEGGQDANITGTTVSVGGTAPPDNTVNIGTDVSELRVHANLYFEFASIPIISTSVEVYLERGDGSRDAVKNFQFIADGPDGAGFQFPHGDNQVVEYYGVIPENVKDEDIKLKVEVPESFNPDVEVDSKAVWYGIGQHTHDINTSGSATTQSTTAFEPGVAEWDGIENSPEHTPNNVDVLVNGSTVESVIGSGEFTTTVDIGGELSPGFNEIEITSATLGHIRGTAFIDVFRQITN